MLLALQASLEHGGNFAQSRGHRRGLLVRDLAQQPRHVASQHRLDLGYSRDGDLGAQGLRLVLRGL